MEERTTARQNHDHTNRMAVGICNAAERERTRKTIVVKWKVEGEEESLEFWTKQTLGNQN